MSEFQDEYSESVEVEFRKLEGALLNDAVNLLAPSEPICLPATATVHEAITKMLASRRAAAVIVDGAGRLAGGGAEPAAGRRDQPPAPGGHRLGGGRGYLMSDAVASPATAAKPRRQLDRAVVRFAGDSGHGMQVPGEQFP